MRLLDRYVLRSYLVPFAYCLAAFCLLHVLYDLFAQLSRFMEARTPPWRVLQYYGLLLIPSLEYLLPASLLLATLYTLWRLSRNNELTAMRASGVSFYRIMGPFLAVGLAASAVNAALAEAAAPRALEWIQRFAARLSGRPATARVANAAYFNSREHRIWLIDEFDPEQPAALKGVKITQERPDGTRRQELLAERAEWLDQSWWLHNARLQVFDERDQPVRPPGAAAAIPLLEGQLLTETPDDLLHAVKPWEALTSRQMWRYLRRHPEISRAAKAQKRFDLHRRLAMPWACLVVTLFAVPAGAWGRRQSALAGIFLAVACFFSYYVLSHVGVFLGKREVVWPWLAAWLPNGAFLGTGIAMLIRMR